MYDSSAIEIVENNISVRHDQFIYAFSTNTIPNYLKIGDTDRGVDIRIKEWEKILNKRLSPMIVNVEKKYSESSFIQEKGIYFRDYDVHKYLREVLKKNSIDVTDPNLLSLYSKEFFKDVTVEEVKEAVNTIIADGKSNNPLKRYKFYSKFDSKITDFHWTNNANWELRPNQKNVVDNYLNKINKKELLMFAVMRFGKSFTAMQCALKGNKSKVLIVCAKKDVQSEWKQTVEKPKCFKDYLFICDDDLKKYDTIDEILKKENKQKFAIFLTLQNLSGKASDDTDIKEKLKKVFKEHYDLLIIDETHYGAWAKVYGSSISDDEDGSVLNNENKEHDSLIKLTKKIKSRQKLHLSGTPYNLLYDEKFDEDNIIATYQFKDILSDKEKWDEDHFNDIENGEINPETMSPYQYSDNPYFGFPKMLRFAFNLPEKWIKKLVDCSKGKVKWSLTELFKTKKGDNGTPKFVFEDEVLGLLKSIDGASQEDGILSFLNIPKIKNNDVCKHIVMVLPYRSSCDAMEDLLNNNRNSFINLNKYEGIINIAGRKSPSKYSKIDDVKRDIEQYELDGKKTISLTVNRMLTGVTVKEWDTMLMLKNTHSAQEYDQATFRIQNQFVVDYKNEDGTSYKKDMKPQTILVDFDPMRMFEIQGISSRIISKIKNGEYSLDDSIKQELKYFPIITFNADKLVKVEANNLVEIIMQYNKEQSIIDKANNIKMDSELLNDDYIKEFVKSQYKAGLKNAITEKAHKGNKTSKFGDTGIIDIDGGSDETNHSSSSKDTNDEKEMQQKYRMCIACILFYAFLTNSKVEKMEDIIPSITKSSDELERNKRLFSNLRLDLKFIKAHEKKASRITAFDIDGYIKNANLLSKDQTLNQEERAKNALNRFSKISDSEIVSPEKLCNEVINVIDIDSLVEMIKKGGKILDIASKTGEFALSLYQVLKGKIDIEVLKESIYSIPTSSVTYEFTRKIYEILGLNVDCISMHTSFDLLNEDENHFNYRNIIKKYFKNMYDSFLKGGKCMKFSIVVGNPPYQATVREASNGNNKNTVDIYQSFQEIALKISDSSCLIYPAKEFIRGKINTLDKSLMSLRIFNGSNREGERHIPYESSVFGDEVRRIPGDVGLFYYNKDVSKQTDKIIYQGKAIDRTQDILPIIKELLDFKDKLSSYAGKFKFSKVKKVCESTFVEDNKSYVKEIIDRGKTALAGYSKVITNDKKGSGGKAKWYYIQTNKLDRQPFDNYKVVISSGRPNESLSNSSGIEILKPDENFGRSKMCIYDNVSQKKAEDCKKYLSTKFAKAVNMMTPEKFLHYLPDFDTIYNKIDWDKSIEDINDQLMALFGIDKKTINYIEENI